MATPKRSSDVLEQIKGLRSSPAGDLKTLLKILIFNTLYRVWMLKQDDRPLILHPMFFATSGEGKSYTVSRIAKILNLEKITVLLQTMLEYDVIGLPYLHKVKEKEKEEEFVIETDYALSYFLRKIIRPTPKGGCVGYTVFFDEIDKPRPEVISTILTLLADYSVRDKNVCEYTIFMLAGQEVPSTDEYTLEALRRRLIVIPQLWWYEEDYITKMAIRRGYISPGAGKIQTKPERSTEEKLKQYGEEEKYERIHPSNREADYLTNLYFMIVAPSLHISRIFKDLGEDKINEEIIKIKTTRIREELGIERLTPEALKITEDEFITLLAHNYRDDFVHDYIVSLRNLVSESVAVQKKIEREERQINGYPLTLLSVKDDDSLVMYAKMVDKLDLLPYTMLLARLHFITDFSDKSPRTLFYKEQIDYLNALWTQAKAQNPNLPDDKIYIDYLTDEDYKRVVMTCIRTALVMLKYVFVWNGYVLLNATQQTKLNNILTNYLKQGLIDDRTYRDIINGLKSVEPKSKARAFKQIFNLIRDIEYKNNLIVQNLETEERRGSDVFYVVLDGEKYDKIKISDIPGVLPKLQKALLGTNTLAELIQDILLNSEVPISPDKSETLSIDPNDGFNGIPQQDNAWLYLRDIYINALDQMYRSSDKKDFEFKLVA